MTLFRRRGVDLVAQSAAVDGAALDRHLVGRAQTHVPRQFGVAAQHPGRSTVVLCGEELPEGVPARRQRGIIVELSAAVRWGLFRHGHGGALAGRR